MLEAYHGYQAISKWEGGGGRKGRYNVHKWVVDGHNENLTGIFEVGAVDVAGDMGCRARWTLRKWFLIRVVRERHHCALGQTRSDLERSARERVHERGV